MRGRERLSVNGLSVITKSARTPGKSVVYLLLTTYLASKQSSVIGDRELESTIKDTKRVGLRKEDDLPGRRDRLGSLSSSRLKR